MLIIIIGIVIGILLGFFALSQNIVLIMKYFKFTIPFTKELRSEDVISFKLSKQLLLSKGIGIFLITIMCAGLVVLLSFLFTIYSLIGAAIGVIGGIIYSCFINLVLKNEVHNVIHYLKRHLIALDESKLRIFLKNKWDINLEDLI